MAIYFLDSSAVVKRYVTEVGSGWVRTVTDPNVGNDIYLVGVEVISAFVRQNPPLPHQFLIKNLSDFKQDFRNQYQLLSVSGAVVDHAMILAETHRLRGYDAVQLAAAVELFKAGQGIGLSLTFVSADVRLDAAATAEGLTVDNPSSHP